MKTLIVVLMSLGGFAKAETTLSVLFSDRMVLQQKQENAVWGWDDVGVDVTVEVAGQSYVGKAGADGRWEVRLGAMVASAEPKEMRVRGTSEIFVKDILVGEVWLCSGQSNMEWGVKDALGGDLVRLAADLPGVRLMTVPRVGSQEAVKNFQGGWKLSNSESVGNFSAVGYFFGKGLHEILGVPVGLIQNAWGGSAAEAWVKRDVLERDGRFEVYLDEWKAKEKQLRDGGLDEATTKALTEEMGNQHRPGNLYEGTLYPVIGYGMRGCIWYQGETNAGRAYQYADLMELLIGSWRKDWGQGDFPFYFVQLADFEKENLGPSEEQWPELREAQTGTMKRVANTGQAVITDLGAVNDIHPREKRAVAERLLRWALAKDYGYDIVHRSPEYKAMEIKDGKVVLSFDYTGGGLATTDVSVVKGFTICGADGGWVNAEATLLDDGRIEVSSAGVAVPVAVRYAWANNPICNVVSREGLQLTSFRTDDFPLTTRPR